MLKCKTRHDMIHRGGYVKGLRGELMLKVIIADDERLICRLVQALADWESLGMEVAALGNRNLFAKIAKKI